MANLVQPKTKTFVITHSLDDSEVTGQFTTKKLTIMDRSKIGMRRSQLAGGLYCVRDDDNNPTGQGLDEQTDYLNYMIAYLETCLIQKPVWFKLDQIDDMDLVNKVFAEVIAFENTFRKSKDGTGNEATGDGSTSDSQTASNNESKKQNPDSVSKKVVGKEVSASLDA